MTVRYQVSILHPLPTSPVKGEELYYGTNPGASYMDHMVKKTSLLFLITVMSGILFFIIFASGCERDTSEKEAGIERADSKTVTASDAAAGPLNAAYIIEGEEIRLDKGKASHPAAPGSAAMVRTGILVEPQYGDLNNDGLDDAVLFLQHDPGGTGTFIYVAAALYDGKNWQGTQAALLGDRIIPESIEVSKGLIIIHYLGRRPGDPFSTPPSVEIKKVMALEGNKLREISNDNVN